MAVPQEPAWDGHRSPMSQVGHRVHTLGPLGQGFDETQMPGTTHSGAGIYSYEQGLKGDHRRPVEAEDAEAERIRPRDGLPNWRCRQVTR
jgi:hypothetical protein